MIPAIWIPSIVVALSALSLSLKLYASEQQPTIHVVATLHGGHLDPLLEYSSADLFDLIVMLKPDLVCGEIEADQVGQRTEGYYPPENWIVEAAARSVGAEFSAADWRGSVLEDRRANESMTEEQRREFSRSHDRFIEMWKQTLGKPGFRSFLYSQQAQDAIREAHEIRIRNGTEAADGFWITRNREIVNRCMTRAKIIAAKRVVFTFGLDHLYIIRDNLKNEFGLTDTPVPIVAHSGRVDIPQSIIERWKRNIDNWTDLLSDSNISAEWLARLEDGRGRFYELAKFIRTESKARPAR